MPLFNGTIEAEIVDACNHLSQHHYRAYHPPVITSDKLIKYVMTREDEAIMRRAKELVVDTQPTRWFAFRVKVDGAEALFKVSTDPASSPVLWPKKGIRLPDPEKDFFVGEIHDWVRHRRRVIQLHGEILMMVDLFQRRVTTVGGLKQLWADFGNLFRIGNTGYSKRERSVDSFLKNFEKARPNAPKGVFMPGLFDYMEPLRRHISSTILLPTTEEIMNQRVGLQCLLQEGASRVKVVPAWANWAAANAEPTSTEVYISGVTNG